MREIADIGEALSYIKDPKRHQKMPVGREGLFIDIVCGRSEHSIDIYVDKDDPVTFNVDKLRTNWAKLLQEEEKIPD